MRERELCHALGPNGGARNPGRVMIVRAVLDGGRYVDLVGWG